MAGWGNSAALPLLFSIILIVSFGITPAAADGISSTGSSVDGSLAAVPPDSSDTSGVRVAAPGLSPTGMPVSDCTVIDSPGLYELTQDITAPANQTCILIDTDDAILDGNGYTLEGNGSGSTDGYPILVTNSSQSLTNVTIENIRIERWPRPIRFEKVRETLIENVVVRDSFGVTSSLAQGRGLSYTKGADHRIEDSRLLNLSFSGIDSMTAHSLRVVNVTIRDTDTHGIRLDENVNTSIRNSVVAGSGFQGILVIRNFSRPDNLIIENNTIRSNPKNGILFQGVNDSRIRNNTLVDNNNGIRTTGRRSGNLTISGNAIKRNRDTGILLKESERSIIRNNTLRRNGIHGILVDSSSSNTSVRNNTVIAGVATGDALVINYAGNVTAADNVLANYTRGSGIQLSGGYDGFRATGNVICSNRWGVSFDAYSSGAVTIERNRIASNNQDGVRIAYNVPVEVIDIQRNIIEHNDAYGINYRFGDDGVVSATDNWWGSTDGPSSPGSTVLADPFTGALANGTGDAVSENDSNAGVANVHFDPYLGSEPPVATDCPITNYPPSVSVDADSVVVDEGDTATNDGSFADDYGDTVTLDASVGTVTKNADGTWHWSFETTDGPDQSQNVTITVTDEDGASANVTFVLRVIDVPPSVSADDGSVSVQEGQTATNTGSFADPGNDTVTLSASVGMVTKNADGTWDWSYNTSDGSDVTQVVTISVEDEDGKQSEATFDLTVAKVPPSGSRLRMPADGSVYALGTPAPLAGNLSTITNGFNGTVYLFNATTDTWERATGSETLAAMEAAVVVPTSDARALMAFADATPTRPLRRDFVAGWNFVAARYHAQAEAAFPGRYDGFAELLGLFTEPQNQPNMSGDPFVEYTFGGPAPPVVSPFTGYFLYLDAGPTAASSSQPATTANTTAGQTTDSEGVPPALPAAYFGRVELHGLPLANVTVTAVVNGEVRASIRTDARGRFGGAGAFDRKLRVSAAPGATVRFRVAGVNATRTVTYTPGAVTRLTLRPAFGPGTDLPVGVAPRANTSAPPASVTPPALRHGNLTLDLPPSASVQSITASSTNETYSVRINVTRSARNVTMYVRASVIESRIGGLDDSRLLIDGTETEFYVISEGEIRYVAFVVSSFSERTITFTSEAGVSLGDVNGDGSIDTGDVIQVQRSIVGLSTRPAFSAQAADVTNDGAVNTGDVIQIQRFIVGLSSVLN